MTFDTFFFFKSSAHLLYDHLSKKNKQTNMELWRTFTAILQQCWDLCASEASVVIIIVGNKWEDETSCFQYMYKWTFPWTGVCLFDNTRYDFVSYDVYG